MIIAVHVRGIPYDHDHYFDTQPAHLKNNNCIRRIFEILHMLLFLFKRNYNNSYISHNNLTLYFSITPYSMTVQF